MTTSEMTIPEYGQAKYIVLSDCHRGDGSAGDEFARNSLIYKCALEYYLAEGFTYIELGDAEELWENDAFEQIYITHTSVYDLLRRFHDPDPNRTRYLKVWGNHDEVWREDTSPLHALFTGIKVHEAVRLNFNGTTILLFHGHQADAKCSGIGARFSKFVVRHIWPPLQRIGFCDPTRAAENPGRCNEIDEALYHLARGRNIDTSLSRWRPNDTSPLIVVAGHTHRPVYANLSLTERRFLETGIGTLGVRRKHKADPVYYNTGSCVHPRCITGIEITPGAPTDTSPFHFTLVKWGNVAGAAVNTADGSRSYPLTVTRTALQSQSKQC